MLEFYRKHYMAKNKFINLLDIGLAFFLSILIYNTFNKELFGIQLVLLIAVWLKAFLTVICMIKFRNTSNERRTK